MLVHRSRRYLASKMATGYALEEGRLALAHADAQRRQAVAPAAPAQLVQERDHEARPAHAQRMPDGDGAAVHVHLLGVEPELADDLQALRREGLVQLDEVELARLDAGAREQLPHGRNRADAHDPRIDARDGARHESSERLGAERRGLLRARDHERGGAVVDPARVPGGDGAVLAERGPKRGQLLQRRVRAGMLVARDVADRHELVVEAAGLDSGSVPALALEGEGVLVGSASPPKRSATFSPVSPIDSSGNIASRRGFGKRQPSVVSQVVWFPRGNACSGFPVTKGARVIDSAPPATKSSPSPAFTAWHAETTAERPDAQRRLTVTPATSCGSPASKAAMRATLRLSSPAWLAAPK